MRVKTIYSIFEKLTSSRRDFDESDLTEEEFILKKLSYSDVFGLHIAVDAEDREAAMMAIEKAFSEMEDFELDFDEEFFEHDIFKGFARMIYKFSYEGKSVGELVLYSKEEYENEHYGMVARDLKNYSMQKDTMAKYPLPHWIYKLGAKAINSTYPDSVFAMNLALKHLFKGTFIEETIEEPVFYFRSDSLILNAGSEDNIRKIISSISDRNRAVIQIEGIEGVSIVSMPRNSLIMDVYALRGLGIESGYEAYNVKGEKLSLTSSAADANGFIVLRKSAETYEPFKTEIAGTPGRYGLQSARAKILASTKGVLIDDYPVPESFDSGRLESARVFAAASGLQNEYELFYAFDNGIIDRKDFEAYADLRNSFMFETIISFEAMNENAAPINTLVDGERTRITDADSNRGHSSYKVLFSGSYYELLELYNRLTENGYTIVLPKKTEALNKVVHMPVQALGRNLSALLGISESMTDYPVAAAQALISLFKQEQFNAGLDGAFFDENNLILNAEVQNIKSSLKNGFISKDKTFSDYSFSMEISDNPGLITNEGFALATLGIDEENKNVTLYVHAELLKALEDMSQEERDFYLTQLSAHETQEYFDLREGLSDYEQFHRNLSQENEEQQKLLAFASNLSRQILSQREQKKELAGEITAELTRTQELTSENPADIILICGNEVVETFEKALELYNEGAAKSIMISGGYGRLTIPAMKTAVSMGIEIEISPGRFVRTAAECDELGKLTDAQRVETVKISEAEIIALIMEKIAVDRGLKMPGVTYSEGEALEQINNKNLAAMEDALIIDSSARNTRFNFENDVVMGYTELFYEINKKTLRFAYIQKPIQQLRTEATFNSVFENYIREGKAEGISVTVSDFYNDEDVDNMIWQNAGELMRIIIYSLKGDTLPSINNNGFVFGDALPEGIFVKMAALIESMPNPAAEKEYLLSLVKATKGPRGEIFPTKESLLSALKEKTPLNSRQYAEMEMFINYVYEADSSIMPFAGILKLIRNTVGSIIKMPALLVEKITESWNVPGYLKDETQAFIFDTAGDQTELSAYMGSYGAKAFSVAVKDIVNTRDTVFRTEVNIDGRQIPVDVGINRINTAKGVAFELALAPSSLSVADIEDSEKFNERLKLALLNDLFSNNERLNDLKSAGLDLTGIKQKMFINDTRIEKSSEFSGFDFVSLQQDNVELFNSRQGYLADLTDKRITSVAAKARIIAAASVTSGEMRDVESKAKSTSLYNEKMPIAAMLKNEGDTGIGELTSIKNYAETVLKQAGIGGFTMYDLFITGNPYAGNYLLMDWTKVPEARGIITPEELTADITDKEEVNRDRVAARKIAAAAKVYDSLSSAQRQDIDNYYNANFIWLDALAAQEKVKYGIDIDSSDFVKITAMQQMFFERQLSETLSDITEMNVSMMLKGLDAENAAGVIQKWINSGISIFTLDIENINEEVMNVIKQQADNAKANGTYIEISVKSANQTQETVNLISRFGFTPIIAFGDVNRLNLLKMGFRAEIDDETLMTNRDISRLLSETAVSGAQYVDYPIGLLWGETVADEAIENYRMPAKGSKRFGGINLGLFKIGQQTFEESYGSNYAVSLLKGRNMDVSKSRLNIDAAGKTVTLNGMSLPVLFAAAVLGSFAKQDRLAELDVLADAADMEKFRSFIVGMLNALGSENELGQAYTYIDNLLVSYKNAAGNEEERRIEAAKIAGFIQGLAEKLIMDKSGKFISDEMALAYAKIFTEKSLADAGMYARSTEEELHIEKVLSNITAILDTKTFRETVNEIVPIFKNILQLADKNNFTFDLDSLEDIVDDEEGSKKLQEIYVAVTGIMLDLLVDRTVSGESVRKSVTVTTTEAVRSIMAAA